VGRVCSDGLFGEGLCIYNPSCDDQMQIQRLSLDTWQ
jgi:hypothetical protein